MATPTYDLLDSVTLSSSASSVTFSSIDQSYRDIIAVVNGTAVSAAYLGFRLNSDSGSTYGYVTMEGNGSTTRSDSGNQTGIAYTSDGTSIGTSQPSSFILQFMDYSATDKHKTVLVRTNGDNEVVASAHRWPSTSAVTTIEFRTLGGNFDTGMTFYLYGVAA